MNAMRVLFCSILAATSLSACVKSATPAEVESRLKQLTFTATGAAANQPLTLSDQKSTGSRWVWKASVGGRVFNCDASIVFELPDCVPVAQPGA